MKYRNFTPFGSISALTLGGGGIGNVWGKTTRREAIDTALYAIDSGVNHLDMPMTPEVIWRAITSAKQAQG